MKKLDKVPRGYRQLRKGEVLRKTDRVLVHEHFGLDTLKAYKFTSYAGALVGRRGSYTDCEYIRKTSRKPRAKKTVQHYSECLRGAEDYKPEVLKKIIQAAKRQIPGAKHVLHLKPRAYCIAKPASSCAVFVTPPRDAVDHLQDSQNVTSYVVREGSARCEVGKWYVLAYITTPHGSDHYVLDL